MRQNSVRALALAASAAALVALAGCGSSEDNTGSGGGSSKITVTATDSECTVAKTELPAGTHTFAITNKGSKVTEFYVYGKGDRIVAEVENIAPGLTRTLIAELPAGAYQTACKPGMAGTGIRAALNVTGESSSLSDDAQLTAAVAGYQRYVRSQVAAFEVKSGEFAAAVKAGDVAKAKALYPVARSYYERIEPVAESFGDLDPSLDARENDVEPGKKWTGFHKLEKDLWASGDISASGPLADQLMADVAKLKTLVQTEKLTPLQLANGAKELLDEVATGKVTGEEDRYSHTDLWDFIANVEGSKAAVAALRPVIDERDPDLGKTLDERFDRVIKVLDAHRVGGGWKLYTQLTKAEVRALSDAVNGAAEPVSRVAATIAKK